MTLGVGISSMRNLFVSIRKTQFYTFKRDYFVQLTSEHQKKGKLKILSDCYSCHMSTAVAQCHCLASSDLGFDPRQGRKF